MPNTELTIPARDLDAGGKDLHFPLRLAWLRGALEDSQVTVEGDGDLKVRASKSGTDVVITGQLKAAVNVPCARCLAPAHVDVDAPLTALYVPGASASAKKGGGGKGSASEEEEYEFSPEEADVLPYDGDTVVLDDLVRDELVLAVPMIPLCSEDCPGMADVPPLPEEAKVDPRLLPLLRLKKQTEKKE